MVPYVSRWTVAGGWAILMAFVGAFAVPTHLSGTMFTLVALAGLFVSLFGSDLLGDSQAPRSVNAILADLEADRKARPSRGNR
jgi:Co/Zn/Cd efflux system component